MRSEDEVQNRIRYLLMQEVDKQITEACAQLPRNCKYNHQQALDTRKEIEGEPNEGYNRLDDPNAPTIGLCLLGSENPEQWGGTICEDPIDAQRCTSFVLVHTSESISERFHAQIKDLDWVKEHLPEVYGLLWALGSETMPVLPWWKALWLRFMQIRPDVLAGGLTRPRPIPLPRPRG